MHPVDRILVAGPVDRISWEEAQRLEYRPLEPGERFGPRWATWWFQLETAVDDERARFLWEAGGEAALWQDGRPLHGLDRQHHDAPLPGPRFEVELACYEDVSIERCEVGLLDPEAWRLYWDFETLRALEAEADSGLDPAWAGELGAELNRFCNELDPAILDAARTSAGTPPRAHEVAAVGHAHLDTAWLWPLAETKRKAVRTLDDAAAAARRVPRVPLRLLARPSTTTGSSGRSPSSGHASALRWPTGGFVPVGGTWVEPDCNIPSGESLVRQFLHGQRWFESRFGLRCTEFWSPDVFGYNAQLPQLMRGAGITRFFTQKLSWNRFTRPEFHTFIWQGHDGSEVLAHFPPADTYNSEATVGELRRGASATTGITTTRAPACSCSATATAAAGPTAAMLETLRRARDLKGFRARSSARPGRVLRGARGRAAARGRPSSGELYLEYHRGTYTTQARVKRGNRRCEQALHDAEFLAAVSAARYPRDELDRLWKLLLAQPVPRHPARVVDRARSTRTPERELAAVEAGADARSRPPRPSRRAS